MASVTFKEETFVLNFAHLSCENSTVGASTLAKGESGRPYAMAMDYGLWVKCACTDWVGALDPVGSYMLPNLPARFSSNAAGIVFALGAYEVQTHS